MTARDPRSRAVAILLAATFLVAALLLVAGTAMRGAEDPGSDPYAATVNRLIRDGAFRVEKVSGEWRVVPTNAAAAGEISRIHWLADDMRDINLWGTAGDRVLAYLGDRSISRPFAPGGTWHGELEFGRAAPVPTEVRLVPDRAGPVMTLAGVAGGAAPDALLSDFASLAPITAPVIRIACGTEAGDVVRLYLIGGYPVVDARRALSCQVRVGEHELAPRCRRPDISPDACPFAAIEPGETLAIIRHDGARLEQHWQPTRPRSGIILRTVTGEPVPDPSFGPFLTAVRTDLEVALRGCQSRRLRIRCDESLRLSFDEQIQHEAAAAIDDHFRSEPKHLAAIVVMNAVSGEVMAMAGAVPGDSPRSPNDPSRCQIPTTCLLPIGSAAKPMFASAILHADARLASLTLARTPDVTTSILGLGVGRLKNHGGVAVDFTDFLRRSDNYYGASLLLLASAAGDGVCAMPPIPENRFTIAGSLHTTSRPRSAFERGPSQLQSESCRPAAPAGFRPRWAESLAALFDLNPWDPASLPVGICDNPQYTGDQFHDASPWSSRFEEGVDRCAMHRSALARQWFNIQAAREFRGDLIPLLLGNGSGRWSAVKLAEAYSRIVTGTQVRASYLPVPAGNRPAPLGGFAAAQEAVTHGLAQVLHQTHGSRGTASGSSVARAVAQLQHEMPADILLGAFAKTGTMEVPGESLATCPRGLAADDCYGHSFVIVLVAYDRGRGAPPVDPATQMADRAALSPRCAITIAVNLPAWHRTGSSAMDLAAQLIGGAVGRRLLERTGPYCAART